jgi:L-aspartate oxidase
VDGECVGFDALRESGERLRLRARATVLASGGPCGLYRRTTNPTGATGDGLALAYSAGAVLADLEFVQFHPTAVVGHGIDGLLISEAVRGEGAWLIDENGERFMTAYHPAAELAPRDVVSRAVRQERVAGHETYLTAAHLKPEFVRRRFPSLVRLLDSAGLDLCSDRIPVAPAAHFMMGGVRTDLVAASSVPRLYAVGEVACHGTHGANRLASNGLLECLVFGHRAASASASLPAPEGPRGVDYQDRPAPARVLERRGRPGQILGRAELGELLDLHAGVVRDADGLQRLVAALPPAGLGTMSETVARLLAESALFREESRGGHFRADFPQARADFAGHTFIQRAGGLGLGDWSEEIAWPRAGTGSR